MKVKDEAVNRTKESVRLRFLRLVRNSTFLVLKSRLMTMSPLHPCGKPCSRGTHETVKNLPLFSSIINGIMMEVASNLNPVGVFSVLQSNQKFYYIYTVTIVIHKSRNLIGTLGIAKFGPK